MYVSYEDGDTEKMLQSEFNNIHQSMGRERERKRGLSTLCKALPNSSLSERDSDGVHPLASEIHVQQNHKL